VNLCPSKNDKAMFTPTHLHAMIIHFPIALLVVGFLSEIIAFITKKEFYKNVSVFLLLLGALGAIAAYLSGDFAGEGIDGGPLELPIEMHEEAAVVTLWLSIVSALYSVSLYFLKYTRVWTKWVGLILFGALIASVARTGYLGGQLVYKHGAGVEIGLPDFNAPANEDE